MPWMARAPGSGSNAGSMISYVTLTGVTGSVMGARVWIASTATLVTVGAVEV
jgi:hypothetical protein